MTKNDVNSEIDEIILNKDFLDFDVSVTTPKKLDIDKIQNKNA